MDTEVAPKPIAVIYERLKPTLIDDYSWPLLFEILIDGAERRALCTPVPRLRQYEGGVQ